MSGGEKGKQKFEKRDNLFNVKNIVTKTSYICNRSVSLRYMYIGPTPLLILQKKSVYYGNKLKVSYHNLKITVLHLSK